MAFSLAHHQRAHVKPRHTILPINHLLTHSLTKMNKSHDFLTTMPNAQCHFPLAGFTAVYYNLPRSPSVLSHRTGHFDSEPKPPARPNTQRPTSYHFPSSRFPYAILTITITRVTKNPQTCQCETLQRSLTRLTRSLSKAGRCCISTAPLGRCWMFSVGCS